MGRKRMADGKQRVLATRVDEDLAGRAEGAAGDGGLSAWLRGLVEGALRGEDPCGGPVDVDGPYEEPAEDGADEPEDATPRCPNCEVPTTSGDLCADCVIEEETGGGLEQG